MNHLQAALSRFFFLVQHSLLTHVSSSCKIGLNGSLRNRFAVKENMSLESYMPNRIVKTRSVGTLMAEAFRNFPDQLTSSRWHRLVLHIQRPFLALIFPSLT